MQRKITQTSRSVETTIQLGERLAKLLKGDETIALVAPLGSGKTHFTKGIAKGLGVKAKILSPTFVLERIYNLAGRKTQLHHFDAYRISQDEAIGIGLTEILGQDIVVVEWADRVRDLLGEDAIWIEIKAKSDDQRELNFLIPEKREYIYEGLR